MSADKDPTLESVIAGLVTFMQNQQAINEVSKQAFDELVETVRLSLEQQQVTEQRLAQLDEQIELLNQRISIIRRYLGME